MFTEQHNNGFSVWCLSQSNYIHYLKWWLDSDLMKAAYAIHRSKDLLFPAEDAIQNVSLALDPWCSLIKIKLYEIITDMSWCMTSQQVLEVIATSIKACFHTHKRTSRVKSEWDALYFSWPCNFFFKEYILSLRSD